MQRGVEMRHHVFEVGVGLGVHACGVERVVCDVLVEEKGKKPMTFGLSKRNLSNIVVLA